MRRACTALFAGAGCIIWLYIRILCTFRGGGGGGGGHCTALVLYPYWILQELYYTYGFISLLSIHASPLLLRQRTCFEPPDSAAPRHYKILANTAHIQ